MLEPRYEDYVILDVSDLKYFLAFKYVVNILINYLINNSYYGGYFHYLIIL